MKVYCTHQQCPPVFGKSINDQFEIRQWFGWIEFSIQWADQYRFPDNIEFPK